MQPLRIVWLSVLSTQLLFPVLLWALPPGPEPADDRLVLGLAAVAGLEAFLSLAWGRLVALTPTPNRPIIRWVFAEAVTLCGFVLGFLGGPPFLSFCLMSLGFLLILVQPPREAGPG
jgi:hypothetical protein